VPARTTTFVVATIGRVGGLQVGRPLGVGTRLSSAPSIRASPQVEDQSSWPRRAYLTALGGMTGERQPRVAMLYIWIGLDIGIPA
jgi:hypothetical protein